MNSFPRHLRGPSTAEPNAIALVIGGGGLVMSAFSPTTQLITATTLVGGFSFVAYVRTELRIRKRLRALDTVLARENAAVQTKKPIVTGAAR